MARAGVYWVTHIIKEHTKGKKIFAKCWECWLYYSLLCLTFVLIPWKIYNKSKMSEILQWVLIVIAISIPAIIVALINYYAEKKKKAAETEKIKLENKITKEITYDQLQKENKHKDIKSKIEIFSDLNKLEAEIKSKENKTANDQKKLESLEAIKKEFKETFEVEVKEKPEQIEERKDLEVKKKLARPQNTKKVKPAKN